MSTFKLILKDGKEIQDNISLRDLKPGDRFNVYEDNGKKTTYTMLKITKTEPIYTVSAKRIE
jgi:hypothetical protein